MAWTSLGYDGSINETGEAIRSPHIGSGTPIVVGSPDFKVALNSAADRTVTVAPGTAWGFGVLAISDAALSVQLPTIATGTRWDAIVLRRDWQNNLNTVVGVTNAVLNSQTLPAALAKTPGVLHDQVLALVQVTAGQTKPTGLLDLRAWAGKVVSASNLLAIPAPVVGMEAVIGNNRYRRTIDTNGNPVWTRPLPTLLSGSAAMSTTTGWTGGSPLVQRCLIDPSGTHIQYDIEACRTGATFRFTADGAIGDIGVCTVNGPKPDRLVVGRAIIVGSLLSTGANPQSYGVDIYLTPSGTIAIYAGPSNIYLRKGLTSSELSFRTSICFQKASA